MNMDGLAVLPVQKKMMYGPSRKRLGIDPSAFVSKTQDERGIVAYKIIEFFEVCFAKALVRHPIECRQDALRRVKTPIAWALHNDLHRIVLTDFGIRNLRIVLKADIFPHHKLAPFKDVSS